MPRYELPTTSDGILWDIWMAAYALPTVTVADELGIFRAVAEEPGTALELAARLELAQTQLRAVSELPDVSADEEQARLETQLAERGQEIRRLQKELAEAERTGRELVRELAISRAPTTEAPEPEPEPVEAPIELQEKLDALARLNAEREADLAATRWALQAVEARAELVAAAELRAQELERELASLRSELERVDQTRGAS